MWISPTQRGVLIRIHVQPKASKTEISGAHGDRLKIRVAAPPVEGAANEELLDFLRKRLQVPAQRLILVRGHASRAKDLECLGLTVELARELLVGA